RRWLKSLAHTNYDRKNINGIIFSEDFSDRVFSYTISHKIIKQDKETKKKIREWKTDDSFEVLRRELELPTIPLNGFQIANGEASTDKCKVLLTYREGIQQDKEEHGIKAGVPPLDKLEAFDKITEILKPLGIEPFKCSKVKVKRGEGHTIDDTSSRMINTPNVLRAMLQFCETESFLEFESQYIEELKESEIERLLKKHFELSPKDFFGEIKQFEFNKKIKKQKEEIKDHIELNRQKIKQLSSDCKPLLTIFYEQGFKKELKLLEIIIRLLWGNSLKIQANSLPEGTHGPKNTLDDSHETMKNRSKNRIQKWKPLAQQIAKKEQPTFCLVMARKLYFDSGEDKKDDPVNKPSTRKALTEIGRSCVQFIRPPQRSSEQNKINISNFIWRTQAAMKDLFWAHTGRIDNVCENVDKWLPDNQPKEIIGITIVRKNSGRYRSNDATFLPIAIRIDVEKGRCEMSCAYEKGNQMEVSEWKDFSKALATVSQVSPVRLALKQDIRETRFMEFVDQTISQSVKEGKQPLVMINSSNCASLWKWLRDSDINASDIDISGREKMQQTWKDARIVRIRQELAPGIIDDKIKRLVKTWEEDTRTKEELDKLYPDLESDEFLPTPSGSISGLFELATTTKKMKSDRTQCITYFSIGKNTLHEQKRGASCYHKVKEEKLDKDDKDKNIPNQAGLPMYTVEDRETYTDMWPTPNPLEIVVTLRQEGDDPDRIAALVESLRYGFGHYREGTALPAPLFFERVVRDYLSAFTLDDPTLDDQDIENLFVN
ncbi:RNaseH domain-containing protein, partial [Spirulina sp. 06S082]|uniref:RNaseH domain-containing protein n=1 Tax=Spirulina sp. 06S082 TaxID=3110248 RepID=UPI002B218B90